MCSSFSFFLPEQQRALEIYVAVKSITERFLLQNVNPVADKKTPIFIDVANIEYIYITGYR